MATEPHERILVVIGAGHLPILQQCADASPEYERIEVSSPGAGAARIDAEAEVRRHSYVLTHDGRLGGPGLDVILDGADGAQFVLIGEPHKTDQLNRFVGDLFELLHERDGFDRLIVEQDGLIMDRLCAPGVRGDLEAIRAAVREHPEALHFGADEELALYARVGRLSGAASPIWGVDRIHDASLALEALGATRPGMPGELAAMAAAARVAGPDFLGTPDDEFDRFLEGVSLENGSDDADVLDALRVSREDFLAYHAEHAPYEAWGFAANERREELMKTRFVARCRRPVADGAGPVRAVAKMGHWHMTRGIGPGSVPTFGNFLADVARMNGFGSISIAVEPVNVAGRHRSITDHAAYAPLTAAADPGTWIVVDLRSLRGFVQAGMMEVSPETREMIFGFDLLLLMGGTDAGEATWAAAP